MQSLKHKEDLDGTKRPWSTKLLFVGAKVFMKVATKGDAFLFMFFLHQMLTHVHIKFLPSTKNLNMRLKKEIRTPCPSIDHTTAPLILWKECNLHSNTFIICHKMNLQHFINTSMRTSRRGSFDIQSL
jgi:hypothetical protein